MYENQKSCRIPVQQHPNYEQTSKVLSLTEVSGPSQNNVEQAYGRCQRSASKTWISDNASMLNEGRALVETLFREN